MASNDDTAPGVPLESPVIQHYLTTRFTLQHIAASLGIAPDQETHILAARIEDRVNLLCESYLRLLVRQSIPKNALDKSCDACGKTSGAFALVNGIRLCEECYAMSLTATNEASRAFTADDDGGARGNRRPCAACRGTGEDLASDGSAPVACRNCGGTGDAS